jgi:PTS system mannose-specific IIA component
MVGIVIVTHGLFGNILIDTAESIIDNRLENVAAVSIDLNEHVETLRKKINNGIMKVSQNDGVLILTDMFGGTPSNLSYSFLEEGRIEVLSGVNLPMLIKAVNLRRKDTEGLHSLAKTIETYGKKSISLASELVKGNKRQ